MHNTSGCAKLHNRPASATPLLKERNQTEWVRRTYKSLRRRNGSPNVILRAFIQNMVGDALVAPAYTISRLSNTARRDVTSYKLLWMSKLSLKHQRVFG